MASSLTPGILAKLLENSKNRSVQVTGQHRSALLQVVEIVPSLGADSDPWKNRGFYLKLSDSAHKTYVSMAEEDVDLVFNNHIQLGGFVHVSRFDSGSPFPVARGVKAAAGRKCECVGSPVDLVVNVEKGRSGAKKKKKNNTTEAEERGGRRVSVGGGGGRSEVMEMRRLSLDSMRRGWETSRGGGDVKNNKSRGRSKDFGTSSDSASVVSDTKASPRKASLLKDRILNNSPLKCQSNTFSINTTKNPSKKDKLLKEPKQGRTPSHPKEPKEATTPSRPKETKEVSTPSRPKEPRDGNTPGHFIKVPLKFQEWSDQSILWDSLATGIHDSGKEAIHCRNTAFSAAVDALHEATASENVIQCMSRFAELCKSSDSPGVLIEQFLDLYQTMQQKASEIDALLKARSAEGRSTVPSSSQLSSEELDKVFLDKSYSATSWVQAAVENNLSKFSLLRKQDKSRNQSNDQHHYVVLEPPIEQQDLKNDSSPHVKSIPQNQEPHIKKSPQNQSRKGGPLPKRRLGHPVVKKTNDENVAWSKGEGLKEVASVAEKLLLASRGWFLKYLEDSLNVGFGLNSREDNEVGTLLGQLKRVNQWLEDATGDRFEVDEKVEKLRKKLYAFLLENLDSAIVAGR